MTFCKHGVDHDLDCDRCEDAAEIERALRELAQGDGWKLIHVNKLREWKDKVNTLASLTAASDRRERGIALKQAITDVISATPQAQPERNPIPINALLRAWQSDPVCSDAFGNFVDGARYAEHVHGIKEKP